VKIVHFFLPNYLVMSEKSIIFAQNIEEMPKADSLQNARKNKQDEFYTQYCDINNEISHYASYLKGKIIYCNCDTKESEFYKFFVDKFNEFGLKKVIITAFNTIGCGYKVEYDGEKEVTTILDGNGSYKSKECLAILDECDIVCTNPPFSLFVDFIKILIGHNKDFIIIGNQNSITNNVIFNRMKENKLWFGYGFKGLAGYFSVPGDYVDYATCGNHKEDMIRVAGVTWFTSIKPDIRKEQFKFERVYKEGEYQRYDDAPEIIEVPTCKDIPDEYYGLMGVPITFMNKYNDEQFEIICMDKDWTENGREPSRFKLNGKTKFARIIIRRKKNE